MKVLFLVKPYLFGGRQETFAHQVGFFPLVLSYYVLPYDYIVSSSDNYCKDWVNNLKIKI